MQDRLIFSKMIDGRKNAFNQMRDANQRTKMWRAENQTAFLQAQTEYLKKNFDAMNSGGVGMYTYLKNGGFINYIKIFNL